MGLSQGPRYRHNKHKRKTSIHSDSKTQSQNSSGRRPKP